MNKFLEWLFPQNTSSKKRPIFPTKDDEIMAWKRKCALLYLENLSLKNKLKKLQEKKE